MGKSALDIKARNTPTEVFQLAEIGLADETKVHKHINQIRKVATETKVEQKESCSYVSEPLAEYEYIYFLSFEVTN